MRRNSIQTADLTVDILKRVRASSGISRVQVARELGLAPSTTGVYVERLIADGFLMETAVEDAARRTGRPPRLLHMNPDGGEFIGVDFEARNIMAMAVDFADRPLRNVHKEITKADSVAQIVDKIAEAIHDVLPSDPKRLLAIGVGVPGIVDSTRGIAVSYKYISGWQKVALAAQLRERFGVPVFLENTIRSMALAELWFGQGKGYRDFLCIGIRSGIGVGMVMDGHLYRGGHSGAGELGRWHRASISGTLSPWFAALGSDSESGPELQDVVSALAIPQALQRAIGMGRKSILRGLDRTLSLQDIAHAVQLRDALCIDVVTEAAVVLGHAVGQLVLIMDPAKIILAGPLSALGETFLKPFRDGVAQRLKASGSAVPEIENSTMGEYCGALGAAALALHEWRPVAAAAEEPARRRGKRRNARATAK